MCRNWMKGAGVGWDADSILSFRAAKLRQRDACRRDDYDPTRAVIPGEQVETGSGESRDRRNRPLSAALCSIGPYDHCRKG